MKRIMNIAKMSTLASLFAFGLWSCDAGYDDWDADGNGAIDETEFSENISQAGYFEGWNNDNDEGLSEEEFYSGIFNTLDDNNNNMLDNNEWEAYSTFYKDTYNKDMGTFDDWDSDNDDSVGFMEFSENAGDLFGFSDWDANNNNVLDQNEFETGIFDLWDDNDDNQIDEDEFSTWEDTFVKNGEG